MSQDQKMMTVFRQVVKNTFSSVTWREVFEAASDNELNISDPEIDEILEYVKTFKKCMLEILDNRGI